MFGRKKSNSPGSDITQGGQFDDAVGIEAIIAAIDKLYPEQKNHVQTNALMKFW